MMTPRAAISVGLVLLGAALGLAAWDKSSATPLADERDSAQLRSLALGREALHASILQARAGLELSFDPINRAILTLRTAASEAELLRRRGSAYDEAAEQLLQSAQALQREETSLETFKTDLALMRASSRSFPASADALIQRVEPSGARRALDELRTRVEHYEAAPSREGALHVQASMSALETLGASLDEPIRADLDVLLGHTRALVERRERLDRLTRALVASPVRAHIEAARAAYERAVRSQSTQTLSLRIAAGQLACAAVLLWVVAAWRRQR